MGTIKNIAIVTLAVSLILSLSMTTTQPVAETKECVKEPYEQNQIIGGCVMQKASGRWIRTCG
jgi:hypothetical protein